MAQELSRTAKMIKADTSLDICRKASCGEDVLSADGLIARSFSGYEFRPQQLQMASAIKDAFADRRHLVVEAGTGIGKSFAYLVPAINPSEKNKGPHQHLYHYPSGAVNQ
jgi:ATP-dependent helicase YprA (DUF1998 family)